MKQPITEQAGARISAAEWNRMTREVYRLSRLTTQSPVEMTNVGSNPQMRLLDPCINAKITTTGWVEVQPKGDGTWNEITGGRKGYTLAANPAYEVNGNLAPIGSIVKLYVGFNGEYLYWWEECFDAVLYKKTYTGGEFKAYSWARVVDRDDPVTLEWIDGNLAGGPGDFPAYHEQDIDLPVWGANSYGPQSPATAVNDATVGNVAWTNPGNIVASDDTYATCALPTTQSSQYLKATNFSFGIDTDALIVQVLVEVERKGTSTDLVDTEVKLVKGGVISGNNKAQNIATPASDAYQSYPYSPSSWGVKLTGADVNASTFGVVIRYKNNNAITKTVSVDHVRITVTYLLGVQQHSVVRLRRGNGDFFLIDQLPWEDLFRRTADADADGTIAFLRYYDQNTNTWEDGEEVRVILVE